MPAHQLDWAVILEAEAAFAKYGSHTAAAKSLGIHRMTLVNRLHAGERRRAIGESPGAYQPITVEHNETVIRPRYRIVSPGVDKRDVIRVLAIGDAHDSPRLPDKARFKWMGRHAHETAPDYIVQIGDFATLDSLNSHDANDTLAGKDKPSFLADVESFQAALRAFDEGLQGARIDRHMVAGNHENRSERFMNTHPEVVGMLDKALYAPLEDHGWTHSPYGAAHFVGEVEFTHVPFSGAGKPYGGMHAENQINRDSLRDVVFGHTHKPLYKPFPKRHRERLTIVNLGCCLPTGHVEEYAKHSLTGWGYGVYDLRIVKGRIEGASWHSMDDLQEKYGD